MVLAIDIGNTNIVIGLFRGKRLVKTLRVPTGASRGSAHYKRVVSKFVRSRPGALGIEGIIISSVAPKALRLIKQAVRTKFKVKPFILGENGRVPIKNRYKRPGQVGQDRLVNAFAALQLYKRKPLIIVDFGTAVTIDVVSSKGAYSGGIIMPGVELSIENLTRRAALLPVVKLRKPKDILGKSTVESMLSGIFYGYASLCDGLIDRLKKRLRARPVIIATGGHARLLSSYCRNIDRVDTQLTLKGLNLIYPLIAKNS